MYKNNRIISISLSFVLSIATFIGVSTTKPSYKEGKNFSQILQEDGRKEITFQFSQDLVPFGTLEQSSEQWSNLIQLQFTPPQSGTIRPISESSFAFVFETPYPRNKELSFQISPNLFINKTLDISVNHQKISNSQVNLPAEPFEVLNAYRASKTLTDPTHLRFSSPVKISDLKTALIFYDSNNKALPYHMEYASYTNFTQGQQLIQSNFSQVLVYSPALRKNSSYRIHISPFLALSKEFNYTFETFKPLQWLGFASKQNNPLTIQAKISSQNFATPLFLEASNPLNTSFSLISVKSTPPVSNLTYQLRHNGIQITGDFAPQQEYQIHVSTPYLKDMYGQKAPSKYSQKVFIEAPRPSFQTIREQIVLPRSKPTIPIQSVNITNLRMCFQVVNSAYYAALAMTGKEIPVPIQRTNIILNTPQDTWTWSEIDLSPLVKDNTSILTVKIYDPNGEVPHEFTTVLMSDYSFTAILSSNDVLVHVRNLQTQKPIEHMMISIWDPNRRSFQDLGRTTSEGTLRIHNPNLPLKALEQPVFVGLLEEQGFKNISFLSPKHSYFQGTNYSVYSSGQLSFHQIQYPALKALLFTDRNRYKENEPIYVNIVARKTLNNAYTSTGLDQQKATIKLFDSRYKLVSSFTKTWSEFGSIDFTIDSKTLQAGSYSLVLDVDNQIVTQSSFQITSITPNEGELLLNLSKNQYLMGEKLKFSLGSQLFTGQGKKDSVSYSVSYMPYQYQSSNFSSYLFGDQGMIRPFALDLPFTQKTLFHGKISLSISNSNSTISYTLPRKNENIQLQIQASSQYNDSKNITDNSVRVLTPIQLGIYSRKREFSIKESVNFNLVALDSLNDETSNVLAHVQISKQEAKLPSYLGFLTNIIPHLSRLSNQQLVYKEKFNLSHTNITFDAKEAGNYRIELFYYYNFKKVSSSINFSVQDQADNAELQLWLDKALYQNGDTALLKIHNPYPKARLLLTIQRDTIREYQTFMLNNQNEFEYPITITSADEPGIYVSGVLSAVDKEAISYGSLYLDVSPENKKLFLNVSTDKEEYTPNSSVTLTINTATSSGSLINGEAIVIVTDRSVQQNNTHIPNPITFFYSKRDNYFNYWDLTKVIDTMKSISNYQNISHPTMPLAREAAVMARDGSPAGNGSQARTETPYTIFYQKILLSSQSNNIIQFNLPNNIGGFNIMVLAYDKDQNFGKKNISITSRKKLFIDVSLPQFVRPSDQLDIGGTVHNFTESTQAITFSVTNSFFHTNTQLSISPLSSQNFYHMVTVPNSYTNSLWKFSVQAENKSLNDAIEYSVPSYHEKQKTYTSLALLVNKATNVTLPHNASSQTQTITINTATVPILAIQEQVDHILRRQSLSLDLIMQRIHLLYYYKDQIIQYRLSTYTASQIEEILLRDSQNLNLFPYENKRLSTALQGHVWTNNPQTIIQFLETLLFAKIYHSYNSEMAKNISSTVESYLYNKSLDSETRAYAAYVLALYRLIDISIFNALYPNWNNTPKTQGLILQTMHVLNYPLEIISQQTSKVLRFTATTGNTFKVQGNNIALMNTLISYYGTGFSSRQLLNSLTSVSSQNLELYLNFIKKYQLNSNKILNVKVRNQKYTLDSSKQVQQIEIPYSNETIELSSNSELYAYITYQDTRSRYTNITIGYTVTKEIFDEQGTVVPFDNLQLNQKYWVHLTITPNVLGTSSIEIIDPLYGGTEVRSPSTPYRLYQDRIHLYTQISKTTTVQYQIITKNRGLWTAPPLSVINLKSPDVFSSQIQQKLQIQ